MMTAEDEKLIDTSHPNLFCLCFPNRGKLSLGAITKIFSEYGSIVGINCPKYDTGFYFVRYRSMEEAQKCLIGLKGHSQIKFQPVKSRYNKTTSGSKPSKKFNQNKFTNGDNSKKNNNAKFNAKQDDRAGSVKSDQCSVNGKSNDGWKQNRENGVRDGFALAKDSNEHCGDDSGNSIDMERPLPSDQSPEKTLVSARLARKFPGNDGVGQERCEDLQNPMNHLNAAKFAELQKRRGITANTFKPQGDDHTYTESYKTITDVPAIPATFMPPSIISSSHSSQNTSREQFVTDDMPPALIAAGLKEKQHVVVAWDVIVANIHPNLGVGNIHEMLRRHNPIYFSDIEIVPEINVRYCYVYFKTQADAIDAEALLDGAEVCGRYLITLRSCRLEAESNVW